MSAERAPAAPPPGAGTRVELPGDRGRLPPSSTAPSFTLPLGTPASQALRSEGGHDLALACWCVLLHRHAQQAELRMAWLNPDGHPGQLRWAHCELGEQTLFSQVLDAVRASRRAPLLPLSQAETGGAAFGVLGSAGEGSQGLARRADVTLWVAPEAGQIRVDYDAGAYARERIAELAAQYELLLEQVATDASRPILDYSLVTPEGRSKLPDPSVEIERPQPVLLPDAFADCAARWPQAPAIEYQGQATSYAALEKRSRALAALLIARGIRRGEVAAVTGQRSPAVVSAMLGVLRSGGVLLTLDPRLPLERRKVMLREAKARHLIAVGAADAALSEEGVPLIAVDNSGEVQGGAEPNAALPPVAPESPAYVFFTSGSTGTPKAVLGAHRGLGHFLAWQRNTFGVGPGDRASQLTALSFDVILRDVFLALSSGSTLCIPDERDALDPARILTWLRDGRITTLHVVPSLARLWLTHAPPGIRLPDLKRVFFAGEPLTDVLVERFRDTLGGQAMVVNLYGPTETTLAKCFHRVSTPAEPGVQPVGAPMPQAQALILNRRRGLCGLNEAGEIAIRTPFRSFGYLNAPEANARAFIQNPFRADPEDLIYLTGDSGRYRTDGLLEILGRIDNQVKIRGIRVEPGEIEATLGHHPNVREAVVVARADETEQKVLVGYVVLKSSNGPANTAISELREFLKVRLPEHMIPSAFVLLERLPLNPNGKVDKKQLPAPAEFERGIAAPLVAPRDDTERTVAAAFEAIMKVKPIGVDDDFFELGGNSLLAMSLLARIEKDLGARLPLNTFWDNGTPARVAALVRNGPPTAPSVLVAIQKGSPAKHPVYWLPGGGGLSVMAFRRVSQLLGADQPVYGLEADLDPTRAPETLEGLAHSYIEAIKAQQPKGPYHLFGFSLGSFTAYEMAVQLRRRGEEVGLLCVFDTAPGDVLNPIEKGLVIAQRILFRLNQLRRQTRGEALAYFIKLKDDGVKELVTRVLRNGANPEEPVIGDGKFKAIVDRNRRAALEYASRPLPRYDGTVTAVLATGTSMEGVSPSIDPRLAWRRSCQAIDVHRVPGNHLSMLDPPDVDALAATLRRILANA